MHFHEIFDFYRTLYIMYYQIILKTPQASSGIEKTQMILNNF